MQQHALARVEGRVEPEPALGRAFGKHRFFEHHVGDQEAVLKNAACHVQAEHAAHGAARAVGHHQPVGVQRVAAVCGVDLDDRAVALRLDGHHLVPPAQVQILKRLGSFDQALFQVVLLQVDHARAAVVGLGLQVELEDFFIAVEGAADVPRHTLGDDGLTAAQPVQDFQRALGVAQAA